MPEENRSRLEKVQYVKETLISMIDLASAERLEMLHYMLELAHMESVKLENELQSQNLPLSQF